MGSDWSEQGRIVSCKTRSSFKDVWIRRKLEISATDLSTLVYFSVCYLVFVYSTSSCMILILLIPFQDKLFTFTMVVRMLVFAVCFFGLLFHTEGLLIFWISAKTFEPTGHLSLYHLTNTLKHFRDKTSTSSYNDNSHTWAMMEGSALLYKGNHLCFYS